MTSIGFTLILYAAAAVLLAVSTTLSLMVRRRSPLAVPLFVALGLAFAALVASLGATVGPDPASPWSLLAAEHRRLLLVLPIVLTGTAWVASGVYRERLADKGARDMRDLVSFGSALSLLCVVVLAIESTV